MTNGTEKQINWATQIKTEFVNVMGGTDEAVNYNLAALRRIGQRRIASGQTSENVVNTVINVYERAFENLKSNEDATFWINSRDHNHLELVGIEAEKLDSRIVRATNAAFAFDRANRNWNEEAKR